VKTDAKKTILFLRAAYIYLGAVAVKPYDILKVKNALVKARWECMCQEHIIGNLPIGNVAIFCRMFPSV
jgi:hypothetical protein